jgi:hypothetical protein
MNDYGGVFSRKCSTFQKLIFLWLPTKMHDGKWLWLDDAYKETIEYYNQPTLDHDKSYYVSYYSKEDMIMKILSK